MIAAALRCAGRLRDTFVLELGRARAEREADQFLKTQGARVLAEREAAEEVSEPWASLTATNGLGVTTYKCGCYVQLLEVGKSCSIHRCAEHPFWMGDGTPDRGGYTIDVVAAWRDSARLKTSASPVAEDGPASTTPPVGVGHPTSVVQETAAGAPGGGVVGDPSPAAGQPNLLGLASVDDLRMAAIGLDAKFDHRDWAALADRLRNLADFWNPAVTTT